MGDVLKTKGEREQTTVNEAVVIPASQSKRKVEDNRERMLRHSASPDRETQ